MRRGTLLTQVLLVNLLLIAAAVIAASIASNPDSALRDSASIGLVLGFAVAADGRASTSGCWPAASSRSSAWSTRWRRST